MSFLYLAGDGFNILERAALVKAPSTGGGPVAADPLYPASGLTDRRFSPPFKWAAPSDGAVVTFDLNLLPFGDGEQDIATSTWVAAGTNVLLFRTAAGPYSGTYTNGLTGDGILTATSPKVRLRASEKVRIYVALLSVCTHLFGIQLRHVQTGLYLDSAGVWQTAITTNILTRTVASWGDLFVDFTMPTTDEAGGPWQDVEVIVGTAHANVSHAFRFQAEIVPGWDFIGVFGHGSTPYFTPGFSTRPLVGNNPDDVFSAEQAPSPWARPTGYPIPDPRLVPPADLVQQSIYNYLATMHYERWARFRTAVFGGTPPPVSQGFGELVLGQRQTFATPPLFPIQTRVSFRGQTRNATRAGDVSVYNPSHYPSSEVTLTLQPETLSPDERKQILYFFHQATEGGRFPMIIVPTETQESEVYYGALSGALDLSRAAHEFSTVEITLTEFPFPDLRIFG